MSRKGHKKRGLFSVEPTLFLTSGAGKALADRILVARSILEELRLYHSVPLSLSEVEAWIWLGTVLADKYPPPEKTGPKPGVIRNPLDKKAIKIIENIAKSCQQSFEDIFPEAVDALEEFGFLPRADRTTNRKRLRRVRNKLLLARENANEEIKAIADALTGHNLSIK
jgi:hypothetical protein